MITSFRRAARSLRYLVNTPSDEIRADLREARQGLREVFYEQQSYARSKRAGLAAATFGFLFKLVDREGDKGYWEASAEEQREDDLRTYARRAMVDTYFLDDPARIHEVKEELLRGLSSGITVEELDAYLAEHLDNLAADPYIQNLSYSDRIIAGMREQMSSSRPVEAEPAVPAL